MANAMGVKEALQKITRYQPVPEFDSPDHPEWLLMRAIVTRWVREHETLAPTIIMPLPLYQHLEGMSTTNEYQARFRELCAELRCTLHDPLPDLLRYSSAQRRRFRFEKDIHPTPEGHAAIADSVRVTVERLLDMSTQGSPRS
jgi:carbamoyltransferase